MELGGPRVLADSTFFSRKMGILTKNGTFEHAVDGGPAHRQRKGVQKGKGAPRLAVPPPMQPSAGLERKRERNRGECWMSDTHNIQTGCLSET